MRDIEAGRWAAYPETALSRRRRGTTTGWPGSCTYRAVRRCAMGLITAIVGIVVILVVVKLLGVW